MSDSPIYGVIFLFKISGTDTRGALPDGTFDHDAADSIFFAKQTIQNACGTQALLSLLLNAEDVDVGPHLRDFREFTTPLPPDVRLDLGS
jgi:ubiquitin carboxyl-terminal hydrolase L5